MRFFREFRGYISDPRAIGTARVLPLKFSYFFRLHMFVAFVVVLALLPELSGVVGAFGEKLLALPKGVHVEKRGADLIVTGLAQPYVAGGTTNLITIDTTGVQHEHLVSSTIFISQKLIDIAAQDNLAEQKLYWADTNDFSKDIDQVKTDFSQHQGLYTGVLVCVSFAYFFFMALISSFALALVIALLVVAVQRLIYKRSLSLRDMLAINLVAITGPVVLWGLFTIGGFPLAGLVEIIACVVYSILGLRADLGIPPAATSGNAKK